MNKKYNNVTILCYSKCSTCIKALKWLDLNNIKYDIRPIKEDNPSYEELKKWYEESNLDIKKFFNTSGLLYKSLNIKDKLNNMSIDETLKLLSSDGMLVKRPLVVLDHKVLVGFNEDKWKEELING